MAAAGASHAAGAGKAVWLNFLASRYYPGTLQGRPIIGPKLAADLSHFDCPLAVVVAVAAAGRRVAEVAD